MSSIRHMAGSFIHAPERFDELAERIARTDRRIDEVIREDAVPYIRQYLDRASENRDWLEKMNHEMSIRPTVWGDPGRLEIDESAAVYTCLFNTNSGRIRIGRYTFAGSRVSVLAGSHDPELTGLLRRDAELTEGCDITIGNGVWLGSGSIILGPCTIGDNAVIAAGAVVTPGTEVPANTVWGGVPARQIRELKVDEEISPDAPAVRRAFDRSNGALYADGWSEKSYLFAEVPGHWLTDETGLVITDRAAWRIRFRKEGEGGCSLRIAGPEGEKTVALSGKEGQRVARLPVREGGRTMLRFSVSPAERIYIALVPAEASEAEEAERDEAAGKEPPAVESPAQPETAAAEAPAENAAEEPAEKDPVALDIEKIMEEIREEVRRHGPYDDIPEFEGLPKAGSVSAKFLRGSIERLTADYVIPISQPDTGRNPVKKVYRKAAAKAVRCVTAPMAVKATDTNLALKTALINAAEVIEMQQKQIDDLAARISELEKKG